MNAKIVKSILLVCVLGGSFIAIGIKLNAGWYDDQKAQSFDYKAGVLSGSMMADLYNISFTDLGASLSLQDAKSQGTLDGEYLDRGQTFFVDRLIIRSAFSIRAAVILMDEHDAEIEAKLGMKPYTGVIGTSFTSDTWMHYKNYFLADGSLNPNFRFSSSLSFNTDVNDTDGDIGSNGTLLEDSYRKDVSPDLFDTSDYDGFNNTEIENLNTNYDDLTTDLLETDEAEDDAQEAGSDMVTAGFSNLESAILEIMKKRVSNLDTVDVPSSRIRIDNYTLAELYHEQVMGQKLIDDIQTAYDLAKTGGLFSSFRSRTPLKFSRLSMGQPANLWNKLSNAGTKTFDAIKGSTFVTNALAFKDKIVKGAVSLVTGIKEKIGTAWVKVKDGFSKLVSGTKKLLAKPIAWINGLAAKFGSWVKYVIYGAIILVLLYVLFMASKFVKDRKYSRRMR